MTMIQATDLRIGNWLKRLDDTYFQVNSADFLYIEELNTRLRPLPIPITEEILLKCGARRIDKYTFVLNGLFIHMRRIGFVFNVGKKKIIIEHLHTLQNLTFALTNTELNIKL